LTAWAENIYPFYKDSEKERKKKILFNEKNPVAIVELCFE